MIKVINSGFYATIQDMGRFGYRSYGVPVSGVMDSYSAQLANAIVGNGIDAAVLEICLSGPKLQFNEPTIVSLSGADLSSKLNNSILKMHYPIAVSGGDILSFGKLNNGFRTYLAVAGGFQTKAIMESRSFYDSITQKSRIENGDELQIFKNVRSFKTSNAAVKFDKMLFTERRLEVLRGPEFDLLPEKLQTQLLSQLFTISKNNNRMGYQLEELIAHDLPSILTSPVLPGTIQLTPSGRLIVLMKDGQTTGGYPRVLQLKERSINVLAQKKAGDSIQFSLS